MTDEIFRTLTYREIGHCRIVDLADCVDDRVFAGQCAEFSEVCERMIWDEQARVIVLSFSGARFEPEPSVLIDGSSLVEQTAKLKQPVIAAISGNATGFGLELALACDIRIACEGAHFGFPLMREGRMPSHGGTQRLPRLIGQAKAMQMLLAGEMMEAAEAQRIGLIHRITPAAALLQSAIDMADAMARKSPLSLSYAKEAISSGRDLTLDQGLKMEMDLYLLLFSTSDRTEGITAFKEKRNPDFKGV
jgi:enoyl-CoA hydratase/carnithine racemase